MTPRAALYLRVSTEGQDLEQQHPELEVLARTRQWRVVETFREVAGGGAGVVRPELERLMVLARRRAIEVVGVWRLDRLGRDFYGNLATVRELDELGVGLVSCRDPWLDTAGLWRKALVGFMSAIAEEELRQKRELTNRGLAAARARGVRLGRCPRLNEFQVRKVLELRSAKPPVLWREIASQLGVSQATVRRAAKKGAA